MGNTYNFKYSQFGDGSLMINTKEHTSNVLQKEEWEELEAFLELRAKEVKEREHISFITSKALEYVKKKDENGLNGFIKRNKETFFTNVLSDVVSSGLLLALTKLSFY